VKEFAKYPHAWIKNEAIATTSATTDVKSKDGKEVLVKAFAKGKGNTYVWTKIEYKEGVVADKHKDYVGYGKFNPIGWFVNGGKRLMGIQLPPPANWTENKKKTE